MATKAKPSLTWAEALAWSSRSSCPWCRIWSRKGTWAGPETMVPVDTSESQVLSRPSHIPPRIPLTPTPGFQQPTEEQQKMQGVLCVTESE